MISIYYNTFKLFKPIYYHVGSIWGRKSNVVRPRGEENQRTRRGGKGIKDSATIYTPVHTSQVNEFSLQPSKKFSPLSPHALTIPILVHSVTLSLKQMCESCPSSVRR